MKHVGFLLNLIALGLFIPGILLPMFSLNMMHHMHNISLLPPPPPNGELAGVGGNLSVGQGRGRKQMRYKQIAGLIFKHLQG